eukprot:CAMPEP_0115603626 /NCGR_PEP_ID=MMETSP0272-20121206/16521_1 /TAXON_ID=71861 /ORGANISM="Scrippsiella trochoidea, Strain CCMP3099" /LENGTH=506 /DNA_ID=CAMNT_0003039147 /DNA_START=28 /DNA_END=1549 /DNA_ORIENTATION=-
MAMEQRQGSPTAPPAREEVDLESASANTGDSCSTTTGDGCSAANTEPCKATSEEEGRRSVWGEVSRFILPVFVPGLLQGKSQTVVIPMLPIFVREELHGSDSEVGLVTSAYAAAQLCSSPSVAVLIAIRLVGGAAYTAFDLTRKAYMSAEVPKDVRGRISGVNNGLQKWAVMIAAGLSGVIAQHLATRSIFLVQAGFTGSACLALLLHEALQRCSVRDPEPSSQDSKGDSASRTPGRQRLDSEQSVTSISTFQVARQNWRSLIGAGGYCAMLRGCRNTWLVALPLHGLDLGMSLQNIGLAVAIFRGVDAFVTITVAGPIMDRYGRKAAAMPTMLLMAVAYLLLPWTKNFWSMVSVACIYAIGNGLSGGILNYFAIGLAPANARTQFLGLWKTVTPCGGLVLPPLFGFITDQTGSMKVSAAVIASFAIFALVWIKVLVTDVPETSVGSMDSAREMPPADAPPADVAPPLPGQSRLQHLVAQQLSLQRSSIGERGPLRCFDAEPLQLD